MADPPLGRVGEPATTDGEIELVLTKIVCDVDVEVTVVIDVGNSRVERPAPVVDVELVRHILEPEATDITVQRVEPPVLRRLEAVVHDSRVLQIGEVDRRIIVADEKIEQPVSVIVKGQNTVAIARVVRPRVTGNVREGPASVVAKYAVPSPLDYVEVVIPVVVEVREGHVHGDPFGVVDLDHSGLLPHLGEAKSSVVAKQSIRKSTARRGDVKIKITVQVVVANRRRGADRRDPGHDVR